MSPTAFVDSLFFEIPKLPSAERIISTAFTLHAIHHLARHLYNWQFAKWVRVNGEIKITRRHSFAIRDTERLT
jgi:hypothetical protein